MAGVIVRVTHKSMTTAKPAMDGLEGSDKNNVQRPSHRPLRVPIYTQYSSWIHTRVSVS